MRDNINEILERHKAQQKRCEEIRDASERDYVKNKTPPIKIRTVTIPISNKFLNSWLIIFQLSSIYTLISLL